MHSHVIPNGRASARIPTALAIAVLACALVYASGLFGGFLFDDYGSIVDNRALRNVDGSWLRWLALALSSDAGVLRRPLSMLSFGVDYWLFGLSPLAFKVTNLVLHVANGLLVFRLATRLCPRLMTSGADVSAPFVALVAMTLWLLHPLNVGSVVYVVQRMNLLAVLFTLGGLVCYVDGRERALRGEPGWLIAIGGLFVFGVLAVLSKENGALIVAYALVVEAVCFRFAARDARAGVALKGFFAVVVALPVILFIAYTVLHPQWLMQSYANRPFTLVERLLTEPRILCDYLLWIFVPLPRWMGIYHDDIATSTGLFTPMTTLPAIALLCALIVAAYVLRRRVPAFSFAVAWFLLGHSMESTFMPLELAFDHRNYLPMVGVSIGLVSAVVPWLITRAGARTTAATCTSLALALAATTAAWAHAWGDPLRLALAEATNHPQSSRAQYEAGRRIIFDGTTNNRREDAERRAIPYFERGKALDSTDMFSASSLLMLKSKLEHKVSDEDVEDLARRARNIRLPFINPFLVVLTAATTGELPLTPDQMKLLVYAALDNPAYPPSMRAMILSDYGHYQFQIGHDPQNAVGLTLAAAAQDPGNPLFQINLAKLALALGDLRQAGEHVAIAEKLNKVGLYDDTIADLKVRLASANALSTQQ
jgi:hypothetical protein